MSGAEATDPTSPPATFLVDRSDRIRLAVLGPDRAKFLHNLTTQDVKRLPIGRGCEAFVTSPQGKTLGYVTLLAADDAILVRSDPGALESFGPHLRKYGIFDAVDFDDRTGTTFELQLAGLDADAILARLGAELPPGGDLDHAATTCVGRAVRVVREAPAGRPGLSLLGAADDREAIAAAVRAAGASDLAPAAFEAFRIAAGTPAFGRDVSPGNLPQEVGRDARAISFVKGCYLGQETVARIDALGHVNRLLKGLRFDAEEPPAPGSTLLIDGKAVGAVTSSAVGPAGRAIGLGYVRTKHATPGTRLVVEGAGEAVVADLPMGG